MSLVVESANVYDDSASALVKRTELQRRTPLDNEQSSSTFYVNLQLVDGVWKISWAERYWSDCWNNRHPSCH